MIDGIEFTQPWGDLLEIAEARDIDLPSFTENVKILASMQRWDLIYLLSETAGLEASVLIDANDEVYVDWGSPGRVPLQAHVGATIPFKVWVHTHPGFSAYWSSTDRNSLAIATGILEHALVLGKDGVKSSMNKMFNEVSNYFTPISYVGMLSNWQESDAISWPAYSCDLGGI